MASSLGGVGVDFWVTSIVVTATPGTGVLFTIAAGLGRGARAGLVVLSTYHLAQLGLVVGALTA